MDANEMYDSSVVELNNQVISDTRETKEEQERFLLHEETDSDDIPSSLLSYFETSKSRAAVCEKLVLEDLEDLDVINLPFELDKDMMTPSEQVTSDSENEESNIPTDTRLSVCPINEDEFMESETLLALEYEAERDKTQHEEMKKEEQRRQTERDFQEQLKKILEAEKLHQKELELKGKRAQEKLEEELLLQQELISNLQKQVENERRMREEEQKRMKDEKDKREEAERKRMEEEMRRKKEEERKIEEMKLKKEEERKREAEERRRMEREEKKKKEEERKKLEDEMRIKEEERKNKEERDRKRREEEEEKEEARKRENIKNMKEKKEVKEVVRKEEENTNIKEDQRPIEEDEKRKREDGKETKKEEQRRQKEERRQEDEEGSRKSDEEIKIKENEEGCKRYDFDSRKMKHDSKTNNKEKKQDEEEDKKLVKEEERKNVEAEEQLVGENKKEVNNNTGEEIRLKEKESKKRAVQKNNSTKTDETGSSLMSQLEDGTTWTSSRPRPLHSESTTNPTSTETPPQHDPEENISPTSVGKTVDCVEPSTGSLISPMSLPELTEKKRLAWMKDCVSWSKLSLQNRRKQKASVRSRRGLRGAAEAGSLPPLCPDALLQSSGWRSLQEVTTVTLEDLPGCSLSTLTQCSRLQSLTLRRCGLRSLEGINQLAQLCYIDVQENDISFINCENMSCLRVLRLGHNKLTSIHGLTGAENVDVLDLSHNSITRIAGLESMRRLQRLSVDHNQLISTKGLRDVYTLLHLNCSHNHLVRVEGLENSALLSTLDLRANSLTEPPSLNNQVLLRELHLDDNSISSLQGLTACWLPLMQHLSVAQNRITQLPSMSDSVSLANLDLRFNCLSELQNVCESLEGCLFLREVHLTGNPFQQENGWRSTLQKAAPGLRAIDDLETDSLLTPPAVQQVSLASGSFLTFCQAQLQQTRDLQQQLSRELSNASSSLDAVQTSCQHFTEALQLAKDQRFAHEYGDTTVADEPRAAGQTTHEDTVDMDSTKARKSTGSPDMESTGNARAVLPNRDRCSWTFEDKSAAESRHDTLDPVTTEPTVSKANSDSVHFSATKIKTSSSNPETAPLSNHPDLDLQNTAAVVIQQLWRKYRQKCGNISSFSTAEEGGRGGGGRGGDGGKPESGPSYINSSVVGQDYAATVIQALWRGFSLRRRLASALAAVTCPDTGEDDTFEEVDVDEFVFDEALLEKQWTMSLPEDSPPRCSRMSEQPLSLKPLGHFPEPSQYILPPPPVWRPKQAWVPGEHVDSAGQRVSPESSNRGKSPASTSVLSGLSERSEKIVEEWGFTDSQTALLMLKRAQKMKSTKQQQKKHPSVRLAVFRNCSYQLGPVEARNKPAQYNRNDRKVGEAELGLQQAEKMERVKQERAKQWLHTQAAHTDQESVHFLPEISPDVLNGGRVQLVADPGYTKRLHHASGLWANSSSAAEASCKESNYPRRNSVGHARKEVPTPQRVTSAPSKKERISHRDNPVQLSGGWGGGKKRDKVYK